ncbi:hypothetical protein [Tuwongella immobilis]|uniref:Uncharacterized protein n=1 Tax=Tuwongella immobilis TaxID=692036 RepID=A0A6C2YRS3_9BACT|nr:hypothetical protein [Tuwongella immobilis]VIP04057.1 Uncharacterized protein OS=Ktedonobacter racemifer DSM 44963 GN=Krac_0815 PE=4 SV=1 [Tuwongella immobilis]VTS05481.1 Uncharacterized protein OS=Ktedonobacter racemifer DSM 44963 GN=Krac_0815 PE=4 SV=1 [Tuwongella immobilis]
MSEFQHALDSLLAIVSDSSRIAQELRPAAVTLCQKLEHATMDEKNDGIRRIAGHLLESDLNTSSLLTVCCGAIIENGGDPLPLAEPLTTRLPGVLSQAANFAEQCEQLAESQDADQAEPSDENPVKRFGDDVAQKLPQAAKAWAVTESYGMGAIAALAHSKAVRKQFQESDLLGAVAALARFHPEMHYVNMLLDVLDDEPLLVLHPESGKGFRLRMSGIADNFQLHTLLADLLIGPESVGQLPGERPPQPAIDAARDQPVNPEYDTVYGPFNLSNWPALNPDGTLGPAGDHSGLWIWNEGRPADILPFEGTRVVLLEAPPYERGWQAGRVFPGMVAELVHEATLSREEVADLLTRMGQAPRP